jgi:hypothetical protein
MSCDIQESTKGNKHLHLKCDSNPVHWPAFCHECFNTIYRNQISFLMLVYILNELYYFVQSFSVIYSTNISSFQTAT